jgi:amidase
MSRSLQRFFTRHCLAASVSAATLLAAVPARSAPAFQLEEATIASIQQAVDAGTLTYEKLVQMYLDRIAAYEDGGPTLNSIITLNPEALATAQALDAERKKNGPRSPLHGIPVLLKDNVDTADMATTNGSVILKNAIPPDDAFITKQLRDAGAIILGKAAMGEFAGGSYNSVSGQTVNPYNFKRHTGGSSSGSGAAIAANFAVLSIGTDTSTSVRGPAAYNGIVGLRPTTGLISRDGIAPKNLNFDSAGPMARTVTDVALMMNTVAAPDTADPLNQKVWNAVKQQQIDLFQGGKAQPDYTQFLKADSLRGVRLGVVRDLFGGDPEIDTLSEAALKQMQALGATLVEIKLDEAFLSSYLGEGGRSIRKLGDYRFKADWEAYLATFGPKVPKTVAEFVHIYETEVMKSSLPVEASVMNLLKTSLTTSTSDPAYKELIEKTLPKATQDKLALFEKYKVEALVFPYQTTFAPPISNPAFKIDDPTFVASPKPQPAILSGYSSVGFPCIVVPMGFGSQGLPMDIAIFGKPYEEGKLISFGYAYEQATKHRKPSPLIPPLAAVKK